MASDLVQLAATMASLAAKLFSMPKHDPSDPRQFVGEGDHGDIVMGASDHQGLRPSTQGAWRSATQGMAERAPWMSACADTCCRVC